jgi:ABC-type taurine transport system substrate-binding protein
VPRRLVGIDFAAVPAVGELTVDGKVVGTATRVASQGGRTVALAYVARSAVAGDQVVSADGHVGTVRELS